MESKDSINEYLWRRGGNNTTMDNEINEIVCGSDASGSREALVSGLFWIHNDKNSCSVTYTELIA